MFELELLIMLLMIGFNGVFAAYEIALASISKSRLHILVSDHKPGAEAAFYMKENFEGSLAGVQLGITLVGAVAGAIGGAGAEETIAPYFERAFGIASWLADILALTMVVLPLTALTILFGELIPKVFAFRHNEWVCLRLSPPMRLFVLSVWPAVWAFERAVTTVMNWSERHWWKTKLTGSSREATELQELRAIVALARTSRLIGVHQEKIILNAAALSDRPVREVMLPANAISMLDVNASLAEALLAAHMDMHTRFPVTERPGDPQGIIGYVNFKDIVATLRQSPHDATLRAIVRDIPSLYSEEPSSACLERLIREKMHIALIRDSAHRVLGMVTLEDIIEELVGEIEDEYDRLPTHIARSGAGWIVGGGVSLQKVHELTGLILPTDDAAHQPRNLSDWLLRHVGQPVRGGEIVEKNHIRVVVRKTRRHKVQEALIQRLSPP